MQMPAVIMLPVQYQPGMFRHGLLFTHVLQSDALLQLFGQLFASGTGVRCTGSIGLSLPIVAFWVPSQPPCQGTQYRRTWLPLAAIRRFTSGAPLSMSTAGS